MKQINLLPLSIRQRAAQQRVLPFLVLSACIAIFCGGLLWVVLSREVQTIEEQVTLRQVEEDERLQKEEARLQTLAISPDVTVRIAALNVLSKSEVDWQKAFEHIDSIIPADIILTSYSFSAPTGALGIKANGKAPSNLSFAQFMEILRSTPTVQDVKVESYSYNPVQGSVDFSISWQLPLTAVSYPPQS